MQDAMSEVNKNAGGAKRSVAKLNNVLMQMRKNANHPGGLPQSAGLDLCPMACWPLFTHNCQAACAVMRSSAWPIRGH